MPTRAQAARILAGLAVSGVLLYLVLRNISLLEMLAHLGRTHWGWLAVSGSLHLATVAGRGIRWRWLFHPRRQPAWPLLSATMIGYMVNNLLPLRAGEVVRGYLAARSGGLSFWTALATLAVERVLDALSILLILGAVVVVVEVPVWLQTTALTLLALDLIAMGLLVFLGKRHGSVAAWVTRIPRLGETLTRWLGLFASGLTSLHPGPHLLALVGWTLLVWILNVGAIWTSLQAAGLTLPVSAALTVLAFAGIGVSLPSAPGYVGTLQFFIVQALALYAVTGPEAVSVSFLAHAAAYIPITLVGWAFLLAQGISLWEAAREARARAEAL